MRIEVKNIKVNQNYTLNLVFSNGESKIFDVKPFLDKGRFADLKNNEIFYAKYLRMFAFTNYYL